MSDKGDPESSLSPELPVDGFRAEQVSDRLLDRALDACLDPRLSWPDDVEAANVAPHLRRAVDALRVVRRIADVHLSLEALPPAALPFDWGALEVREYLGCGADGEVFRAFDPQLQRDVALKLLYDSTREGDGAGVPEGRRLASIRHAHVVSVFGAACHDGRTGIWMELVRGRSLAEEVAADGPLETEAAVETFVQICSGLAAVHDAGLAHGDVKTTNVIRRSDGNPMLMDLGCAREIGGRPTHLRGTPLYLAPELLAGGGPTPASDIYAAGVLLHCLITGRYPANAESVSDLERQMKMPAWPSIDAAIAAPLASVLRRSLARDPEARFHSILEFAACVRSAATEGGRQIRREVLHRLCAAVLVLMVGVTGFAIWWRTSVRARVRHQLAVQSYEAARELGEADKWNSAVSAARQAVALEPDLAVAHAMLAWSLFKAHAPHDQVSDEADAAIRRSGSADVRDRYWIQAVYYDVRGERARAIKAYEALLANPISPDRDDAILELELLLRRSGLTADAVPYVLRRADLHPQDPSAALAAMEILVETGRFSLARVYGARAQRMRAGEPILEVLLLPAREAYLSGNTLSAAERLDQVVARVGPGVTTSFSAADILSRYELTLGRTRIAKQLAIGEPATPSQLATRRHLLLEGVAYWSDDAYALREYASALESEGGFGYGLTDYLTENRLLRQAGLLASILEQQMRRVRDPDLEGSLAVSRAHLALVSGQPERAIAILDGSYPDLQSFEWHERFYVLASSYEALGRRRDALAALQQDLPEIQPEWLTQLGWLRNLTLRAELDRAEGQEEDERWAVGLLRRALAAADDDFPLVKRLRWLEDSSPIAR